MARSSKEAVLIVLDVGPSVGHEISPNGKSFLSNAQLCASKIIQRKILSKSMDEIGLILLGSERTENPLADGEGYKNIEISHPLQRANWNMVHTIASFKECTAFDGDWLDALIVGADYMKAFSEDTRYSEKKIVLLTNFHSKVSDDEVESFVPHLVKENLQLIVIGPEVCTSDSQDIKFAGQNKSEDQEEGEKIIANIVDSLENSLICGFEDALSQLKYFGSKKVRPTPWRTIMDLGSNIKIPVAAYKKVAKQQRMKTHDIVIPSKASQSSNRDPSTSQEPNNSSETKYNIDSHEDQYYCSVDKDRVFKTVGEESTFVNSSDIINCYMFGTTVVPVTDDDKAGLAFESGPKCLSVLGFTKKCNVPMKLFKGECMQIFPQASESSVRTFAALIQAMDSKEMVAIARKVYLANKSVALCALFPMVTPELQTLLYIELPFAEEVNTLVFPPLVTDKNKPSSAQLDAVDQLITSMTLTAEDDEEEMYDPQTTLDPYEQHQYSLIAQKALNGELFITGSDIDEAVKMLMTPKEELLEEAKPALNKIKELFPLTEVTLKEGARKAAADLFKQEGKTSDDAVPNTLKPSSDKKDSTLLIGTINPSEDFMNMLSKGVPLDKACSLLGQVLLDMISKAFDADDFNKPFKSLLLMRKVCVEKNPSVFNDWIRIFKQDLPVEKIKFWELNIRDQAGLITCSESNHSAVTVEEGKKFLQIADVKEELPPTHTDDQELDDLINLM